MNGIEGAMLRFDTAKTRGPEEYLSGRASAGDSEREKLKAACSDFEAIFIKQMLNSMRKTVEKSGLNDGGMAEDIFEDMLYDEYSKVMAKTGRFGIADMLFQQFNGSVH